MTANRLAKSYDRPSEISPHDLVAQGNAHLASIHRSDVRWVFRNGQVKIEPVPVSRYESPLTADEIDRMPAWIRDMGERVGFLVRRNGRLVEA